MLKKYFLYILLSELTLQELKIYLYVKYLFSSINQNSTKIINFKRRKKAKFSTP